MRGDPARERILMRVREALARRGEVPHPGDPDLTLGMPRPSDGNSSTRQGRIEAFAKRLRVAGGEVVSLPDEAAASEWLRTFALDFEDAAVSATVPEPLRPDLPAAPAERAALGVSYALAGAVQTGSLLLGSEEGRRLQLLPPAHLVWLDVRFLHPTLGEALDTVRHDLPAAVGLHSGPSRSADIGGIVVTGVHGPGRLVAAVLA